ncbi:ABC transporter permease subunit [Neisseria sp. Ec49-e6-T10]|uniref:ABC transporter permease subunit n=1 Tax=Neisseria sp. Ec49-e6-T10 TaxID=3140744 RepID=UPI003EBFECBC
MTFRIMNPSFVAKHTVLFIVMLILPIIVGQMFGNAWVRTLDFALLYIMLALGLNIVVGFAGLLDLGFVAFYAVGAYTYALLSSPHFGLHLPFYITIPLGAVFAALFGLMLGTPVLKLKGDYLAIVTLGFGEIIRIFMNNLNAPVNITNGPQGITGIDPITFGGFSLGTPIKLFGQSFPKMYAYYYLFLFLVIGVIIMGFRLQYSRIGRAWVAMREDDIAAAAMGINVRNMKLLAFALGALSGGIAGGLFSALQGFVSPESFGLMESIMILAMVVLGGMGNIWGVILGAVVLTFLPELLREVSDPVQQMIFGKTLLEKDNLRMLLLGLTLVAMMLLRPSGMLPSRRRKAEFHNVSQGASS